VVFTSFQVCKYIHSADCCTSQKMLACAITSRLYPKHGTDVLRLIPGRGLSYICFSEVI